MLFKKITNEEDTTKIVTKYKKCLNNLFNSSPNCDLSRSYGNNFNQNISSWDVGNVTSMIDAFIIYPPFTRILAIGMFLRFIFIIYYIKAEFPF